jgi:hypothetical protein
MATQKIMKICICLISVAMAALVTRPVYAQLPTGNILGTVRDVSGGVVPSATVTVKDLDTGEIRTTTTAANGDYQVPALPIGHYQVSAEHTGYKVETQSGIQLQVTQEAEINFVLQVGSSEQQVQVNAEATEINTSNASLGSLVNSKEVENLPLNGRNYQTLSLLQPGIVENHTISFEGGLNGTIFDSNGLPTASNYFMLDGAPLMNAQGQSPSSSSGSSLGIDGIEEFKIISTGIDATYGMLMGAQVVLVSKAGTNQFHGDAYDYVRNSIFDSRNFFDYGYELPGAPRLPHLSRNQFGGAFGGPIKTDKTFFFGAVEALKAAQGVTTVDSVPDAGCHGAAGAVVWNGTGTQPAGSIGPCTALGANPSGAGTNTQTISSVTAPLLKLFPIPNLPNDEFTFPSSEPENVYWGQMRVDHTFSAADSMFARYTIDNSYLLSTNVQSAAPVGGPGFPGYALAAPGQDQFLTVAEDHIFSSHLLNTGRVSISRSTIRQNMVDPNNPTGPGYSFVAGEPMGSISIGGYTGPFGINASRPSYNFQTVFTISDDLIDVRGAHTLKFGTLLHRFYEGLGNAVVTNGALSFSGIDTMMEGIASTYSALAPGSVVYNGTVNRYYAFNTAGFYAQDDWRLNQRLTLNLGFRYEFMTTIKELNGYQSALRNIATDAAGTIGPIMLDPSYLDYSPRVGFAWDVTGKQKTVLSGGFGIYDDIGNVGITLNQILNGTPPFTEQDLVDNSSTQITLPFTFNSANTGKFLQMADYHARQAHALEYHLGLQQQLPFDVILNVAYVGDRGIDLQQISEGNPTTTGTGSGLNTFWPANTNVCSEVVPSCRVNPNWLSMSLDANKGNSWYDSMQVNVVKQLTHGLQFQFAYTWGQNLDTTENNSGLSGGVSGCAYGDDPQDGRLSKGPSCFDITDNARINLLYYFPKLNTSNVFLSKLLNGWWTGNIISLQTGPPFTPILSTQRSRSGVDAGENALGDRVYVNTIASIANYPSTCTSMPGQPAAGANPCLYTPVAFNHKTVTTHNYLNWYNPNMFSLGPVGYLGDAGRDMLRGPGLKEWDPSFVKDTAVKWPTENANIQFRAEIFNALNTPGFGIPPGTTFKGSTSDIGPYSEAPSATEGRVTSTNNTSRQIQFALKLSF